MPESTRNPPGYHASHPVHTVGDTGGEPLALKREGDTILVYPGPVRLTLSEWASAVAFTSLEGEHAALHRAILALLGEAGKEC